MHTFQGNRERIHNKKFSKVNALSKGNKEQSLPLFSTEEINPLVFNLYLLLYMQETLEEKSFMMSEGAQVI